MTCTIQIIVSAIGFAKIGLEPITNTPEEFAAYIKAEIVKWGEAVKASGGDP